MTKKTKIVCTIGPATESQEMLEKLLKAGMDVMRLNFSHGNFEEHGNRVINLKNAIATTGMRAAVLQDLSGPKIRLGAFYQERVQLKAGENITITTEEIVGDEKRVSINYKAFPKEVKVGDKIMVDDGKKVFEISEISGEEVVCKILVGGDTKGKRGVNLPDSELSVSSLTEKDMKDLEFGITNDVDFIALSFVRNPEDISNLRQILKDRKSKAKIIAKIETPQAIKNIDEIIKLSDGIMVARGDLAIEIPTEKVPLAQKEIIKKCNDAGKPVITATQMLESMIKNPVPTRAEVSDVANAILDGTDAIMLSEETTLGEYPVEAVKVMAKIAKEVENSLSERESVHTKAEPKRHKESETTDSITSSVVKTSHDVKAKAIIALTHSGFTARMISRHKPIAYIFALSADEKTVNQMCLSYGCVPILIDDWKTVQEAYDIVRKICIENDIAKAGDKVVIAAGAPTENPPLETNMILVETI